MSASVNQVILLGHCNTTLSVVLDMLPLIYPHLKKVTIVSNIAPEDNTQRDVPYAMPGLAIEVVQGENWQPSLSYPHFVVSMGTRVRTLIYQYFAKYHQIADKHLSTLVHPFSAVAATAVLHEGVIVNPGAVLAPYCDVQPLAYINRNASIGHHTTIGQLATVNPGATIAGMCSIGEGTTIGAGAVVNDHLTIGKNSIIGAGAVVTKNMPDNVVAFGAPARIIKTRE